MEGKENLKHAFRFDGIDITYYRQDIIARSKRKIDPEAEAEIVASMDEDKRLRDAGILESYITPEAQAVIDEYIRSKSK